MACVEQTDRRTDNSLMERAEKEIHLVVDVNASSLGSNSIGSICCEIQFAVQQTEPMEFEPYGHVPRTVAGAPERRVRRFRRDDTERGQIISRIRHQ